MGQRGGEERLGPPLGHAAGSRELSVQHRPGATVAHCPVSLAGPACLLGPWGGHTQETPPDTQDPPSLHLDPSVPLALVCVPLRDRCGGELVSVSLLVRTSTAQTLINVSALGPNSVC